MKTMNIKMTIGKLSALCLLGLFCFSCANLDYTEETTRDEEWTYNYFGDGIKNLVFDVYAQIYNNEFAANSAYFLAGATDEAQYALETGAVNNYVNGGWSPANPYSNTWTKAYTAIADVNMYLEKLEQTDISDWKYNGDYQSWIAQMELFPYELRFLRATSISSCSRPTAMCLWSPLRSPMLRPTPSNAPLPIRLRSSSSTSAMP